MAGPVAQCAFPGACPVMIPADKPSGLCHFHERDQRADTLRSAIAKSAEIERQQKQHNKELRQRPQWRRNPNVTAYDVARAVRNAE